MSDDSTEWVTAAQAAALVGRGERQVRRWSQQGKIRRRHTTSGRVVYAAADLEKMRDELPPDDIPRDAPVQDLIPQSELMRLLVETQRRLEDATAQAAYARGLLDAQQKLLDDRDALQGDKAALQEEIARLRRELDQARRPWWKRLLGDDQRANPTTPGRPDVDPAGDDQPPG